MICAIVTYTRPGDLVLDPDCGAGTVLVEALRAGRHALGLTARTRSWTLARANITAAKAAGAWRDGSVLDARPKVLATVRAAGLIGRVGLVLTALRTAPDGPTHRAPGPDCDPDIAVDPAIADLAATLLYCELDASPQHAFEHPPGQHGFGRELDLSIDSGWAAS
ncbi:hypothetical protein [Actinocrispum wychmicini]|uniref:hypothetical protein n=1 Tax=Actinocrispum wychmicini TaxID=1213861 RepID=UPI0014046E9D|nr:hypothetical protein [Actinocrispum wychmicini]